MKLRYSATSPFVRKVLVTAIECGLEDKIEREPTNAWDPNTDLQKDNPLGKVPALVTDEGVVLCESPIICDYLITRSGTALIPQGDDKWKVLASATLAQGIMDASVSRIIEMKMRPEEFRWPGWIERQKGKIANALDHLEKDTAAAGLQGAVNIAQITLGCALGYLDFRFGDDAWRDKRPNLAGWYDDFAQRPSMTQTVPQG